MVSIPVIRYTPEQYLVVERQAEFKSELVMGEMIAMAGGSEDHDLICANVRNSLLVSVRKPCRVVGRDMKVNIGTSVFYPDVAVCWGQRELLGHNLDVLLNPTLIVEVLSNSTEGYDLNFKLRKYSEIQPLKELVYVSDNPATIHHLVRQSHWHQIITSANADIRLDSIDCVLSIDKIYDGFQPFTGC